MYYVFKTSRNLQIYHATNLNNLMIPNDTKCGKKLSHKRVITPCVIIRTCYNHLLCGTDLWENSYLGGIHAFSNTNIL